MKDKRFLRWSALTLLVIGVALGVRFLLTPPKPKAVLPSGEIYYTGPMKGRSGQYGTDQFNPYR